MKEPDARTDKLAHEVIGAAIEVHRELAPSFIESVYESALCVELRLRGIRFECQVPVWVDYKGERVGEGRLDLLVDHCLIVELKAVDALVEVHTAQVLLYLKATNLTPGLLINFNVPVLKNGIRRVVRS